MPASRVNLGETKNASKYKDLHEETWRFQCPRHESKYRPDGAFVEGRATRNMDRFPLRRAGDNVVVDLTRLLRSDQQAQDWTAATVAV